VKLERFTPGPRWVIEDLDKTSFTTTFLPRCCC